MHPAERKQNLQRLQRELKHLREEPVPGVHAAPLPSNMLEWHFCIEGPAGSPYQGGYYHGIIRFPQEYPFKPPSIRMLTPSGRFEPNQRICLSMSDFHPETWNCMWSVSSILQGVVSFMLDSAPAIGAPSLSQPARARWPCRPRRLDRVRSPARSPRSGAACALRAGDKLLLPCTRAGRVRLLMVCSCAVLQGP